MRELLLTMPSDRWMAAGEDTEVIWRTWTYGKGTILDW